MRRFFLSVVAAVLAGALPAAAQSFTADEVFAKVPPWGAQPAHVTWSPDGSSFLYTLPSQDEDEPQTVFRYDVRSRTTRTFIDPARYGGNAGTPLALAWSPDGTRVAFLESGSLYVRDVRAGAERAVAHDAHNPQWSPDGNAIAFTRNGDLYALTLRPATVLHRVTRGGGGGEIQNGELDWVYPEELGAEYGFRWSPDGREIAYLRMDERPVTNFPIVDFLRAKNTVERERYPLAGERNPEVSLHVAGASGDADRTVYDAAPRDRYLPFFDWKPHSRALIFEVLDRPQQHLRVLQWASGEIDQLYAQSDQKWIDDVPLPAWLPGGDSLWVLDRDGTAGLYVRNISGALTRLTRGYHVFELLGVDERTRAAIVSAAYPTRRDRSVLRVSLKGGVLAPITAGAGEHLASLAPNARWLLDTQSTRNDPPQTVLMDADSRRTYATLAPRNGAFAAQLAPVTMLEVPSAYGPLDAYMIKPRDFVPYRRYPVVMYTYGGPARPTTMNAFGGILEMYHQLLAKRGFIVFSIDGPASQIDSDTNVRLLFHNLGPGSLLGQRIGAEYLRSLPYVDPARIGIWGWSFGGYETIYALTHTALFKAGVAGAPVTDWRFYDSIYTERYMGKPQDDSAAYDASSLLPAAAALHGPLLIEHGTIDDNVHVANSIALLDAFIRAGETRVDFMPYPGSRHHVVDLAGLRHLYEHMLDWWSAHL